MGLMGSIFHWQPDQFWRATPHEVMAIIDMYEEIHGDTDA